MKFRHEYLVFGWREPSLVELLFNVWRGGIFRLGSLCGSAEPRQKRSVIPELGDPLEQLCLVKWGEVFGRCVIERPQRRCRIGTDGDDRPVSAFAKLDQFVLCQDAQLLDVSVQIKAVVPDRLFGVLPDAHHDAGAMPVSHHFREQERLFV